MFILAVYTQSFSRAIYPLLLHVPAYTMLSMLNKKSCVSTSSRRASASNRVPLTQQRRSVVVSAAVEEHHGQVLATPGTKYAIVVSRFNSLITKGLMEGAVETFQKHGVAASDIDVSL